MRWNCNFAIRLDKHTRGSVADKGTQCARGPAESSQPFPSTWRALQHSSSLMRAIIRCSPALPPSRTLSLTVFISFVILSLAFLFWCLSAPDLAAFVLVCDFYYMVISWCVIRGEGVVKYLSCSVIKFVSIVLCKPIIPLLRHHIRGSCPFILSSVCPIVTHKSISMLHLKEYLRSKDVSGEHSSEKG